ncbi:MAG TPA: 16S rRNA (cytosine(1402)-N(4))-methyltransferase [Chloroflexi bacterium]|nr:16S rRNA (cytosine(1402)-N(4))-methyltransferase [Chloroflexota bacterium]
MKSSYVEMDRCIDKLGWEKVNGIILDLGLSSLQLSQPERGFAFSTSGPLDMRFDLAGKLMAGDIVNSWSQTQIANILYEYGDERQSRRIAKALIDSRPIKDTMQLANIVLECKRGKKTRRHPATKTFQALRIAVNKELANIANVLPKAIDILAPGGRLAVIAFHSLEDRLVKRFFKKESQDCICPPEQISCVCRHEASVLLLNRRPIRPTQFEINNNRRSRSAVLRIVEKL